LLFSHPLTFAYNRYVSEVNFFVFSLTLSTVRSNLMRRRELLIGSMGAAFPLPLRVLAKLKSEAAFEKIEKIHRSEEQWRQILTPQQFNVMRREGTEPPFSSHLNDEKRPGIYTCAGCELPLFSSRTKYESGTGWPSFFDSIAGHLATKIDFKLILPRTEYHCARCDSHQGHVFDDGPPPTGKRWCNNGVALKFIPDQKTQARVNIGYTGRRIQRQFR
jgi:peptide-methionine (R)-S-oxide reductase